MSVLWLHRLRSSPQRLGTMTQVARRDRSGTALCQKELGFNLSFDATDRRVCGEHLDSVLCLYLRLLRVRRSNEQIVRCRRDSQRTRWVGNLGDFGNPFARQ